VGVAVVILLACGFGVLVAAVFGGLNTGFSAIGNRDAPLVEQSTNLYFSVNDMDAQVANVLLDGNDPALAADRTQDLNSYATDRSNAEKDIQQVTVTAAADPAAQQAVGTLINALGQYEALAADAILSDKTGNDQAGRPSKATLGFYQASTDLMSGPILRAAMSLTDANANSLEATYQQNRSAALTGRWLVLLLGVALAGVLLGFQVFLAVRCRRMVNPALAAATLLACGIAIAAAVQLGTQASHLYVAKQQAFDSILALSNARADSYDANADESRYLVDPGRAIQYQDHYLYESQQIAYVGNVGIFGYDAAFAAEIKAYQASNSVVRFGGYLGTEFRNITFPGERAAATNALLAYQLYEQYDRKLRAMAKSNLDQAIAFDVGTNAYQSDWAFNNWSSDLNQVIGINQDAFNAAIQDGHGTGSGWTGVIPAVAVIVIAALALAGTRRRLAEYH
jgi:hypothetical protein